MKSSEMPVPSTNANLPLLEARNLRKSFQQNGSRISSGAAAGADSETTPGTVEEVAVGIPSDVESKTPSQPSQNARRMAVDGVSLRLEQGETLAIAGESGCGKTTLARMLMRLIEPDSGKVYFQGTNLLAAHGSDLRRLRSQMQMVFQDPFSSLNPRMCVGAIVEEPLIIHQAAPSRTARAKRVAEALDAVGLDSASASRYPHEFSGGQRQRIGIARALILRPKLIVADEPVSALDVSVGAQVLELLARLQREFSLTYLVISHSLPVVAQLATRVAIMKAGRFVEEGTVDQVLNRPAHPYTRALLAAVPALPA